MITLKSKIVKEHFINESRNYAIDKYKGCWQPALQTLNFMERVKYTFEKLKESK